MRMMFSDGTDEDGAVTLCTGRCILLNGLHDRLNLIFAYNEVNLNAGQRIDDVCGMPTGQFDAALTAMPLNFHSVDGGHARLDQSQPDSVQFFLPDVRFDLF
jgi:hypothetical protein